MKKILIASLLLLSFKLGSFEVPKLPDKKELECLATNVYREANNEPFAGQVAVAKVTLNRVADTRYPKTICKVVYQKYQFSWTAKYHNVVYDMSALTAAITALNTPSKFKATHYHADYVNPRWGLRKVAKIGGHIFYV